MSWLRNTYWQYFVWGEISVIFIMNVFINYFYENNLAVNRRMSIKALIPWTTGASSPDSTFRQNKNIIKAISLHGIARTQCPRAEHVILPALLSCRLTQKRMFSPEKWIFLLCVHLYYNLKDILYHLVWMWLALSCFWHHRWACPLSRRRIDEQRLLQSTG